MADNKDMAEEELYQFLDKWLGNYSVNKFTTAWIKSLATALSLAGYKKVGKLELIGDDEITKVLREEAQKFGFTWVSSLTINTQYRTILQAQLAADNKKIGM